MPRDEFTDWPIERINLADFAPADYNPRTITPEALERLRKSLAGNGQMDTITVNRRTGNIVSGHQRVKVLLQAGVESVQARVMDVSLDEEKAANIAANARQAQGVFDNGALAELLHEVQNTEVPDLDIGRTAVSKEEI